MGVLIAVQDSVPLKVAIAVTHDAVELLLLIKSNQ